MSVASLFLTRYCAANWKEAFLIWKTFIHEPIFDNKEEAHWAIKDEQAYPLFGFYWVSLDNAGKDYEGGSTFGDIIINQLSSYNFNGLDVFSRFKWRVQLTWLFCRKNTGLNLNTSEGRPQDLTWLFYRKTTGLNLTLHRCLLKAQIEHPSATWRGRMGNRGRREGIGEAWQGWGEWNDPPTSSSPVRSASTLSVNFSTCCFSLLPFILYS